MKCQNTPELLQVAGQLVTYLRKYMVERGYAKSTIVIYQVIAHQIIEWWTLQGSLSLNELFNLSTSNVHAQTGLLTNNTKRAVFRHLRRIYRSQTTSNAEVSTPVQNEIEEYDRYLHQACGLALATRVSRRRIVGEFLSSRFGNGPIKANSLEPHGLMHYVASRVSGVKPGTASVIATAIRSYLKFLQFRGDVDPHLVRIIPSPPKWRLKDYPITLSPSQISALLDAFDLNCPTGLRDHAMALCMLHMGLRAGEVANLNLEDLNWRQSILHVYVGKSRTYRALPLMSDCGNALANYLKGGRPPCASRKVFVRHTVPVGSGIQAENVRGAIRRAYKRAGFPQHWTGTHILRHTAATCMLNSGASLKEVADVLGHQSIDTTIIYTKVNTTALETVSQPWPGGKNEQYQ